MIRPRIFKLFFIGDKNVGRRTLLKEALKNVEYFPYDYTDTTGVDFYKKELTIKGGKVILQIWKVETDLLLKRKSNLFITGSHAALLMYDLTNINSLENLTELPRIIRQQTGEIPILLVGNKSDLIEERSNPSELGSSFAQINNLLGYIEISAKTGLNCEKIFNLLAETIIDQVIF